MEHKKYDFYAGKPFSLPRLVYRRLEKDLSANTKPRVELIDAAIHELTAGESSDFRKFKYFVPNYLKLSLTPEELSYFAKRIEEKANHSSQLKMVFPHVADEFSLDLKFLDSLFDLTDGPKLGKRSKIFTIGSCFARNIASFLSANGYNAKTFQLAEDLNSPFSNAFILDLLGKAEEQRTDILNYWVGLIYPELDISKKQIFTAARLDEIRILSELIQQADCVILTLGNVVDFFQKDEDVSKPLLERILPKYIALPENEDIKIRSSAARHLKSRGAVFRLASHRDTNAAIRICLRSIRSVTAAPIVVTVSPVPIDSVIGLTGSHAKSAIEVDSISKSRLRSALDEILIEDYAGDASVYYFPSYEIVRWIAPMLNIPAFGLDDAASRHVSSPILEGICSLFLHRFFRPEDILEAQDLAASANADARLR